MAEEHQAENNHVVRWRVLDREGCAWGARVSDKVDRNADEIAKVCMEVKAFGSKLDRVFWALVVASVGFAATVLTVILEFVVP